MPDDPLHAPTNSPPDPPRADTLSQPGGGPVIPGYHLHEKIASGGCGEVWRATDLALNRTVAVKMILPGQATPAAHARFLAEGEAMVAVEHPNVARVLATGHANGVPFLVMEYLPGGTLKAALEPDKRMAPVEAAELLARVAHGVGAAHTAGVLHRDLKPANILFDAAGNPKVADFGVAKQEGQELTSTGAAIGTPYYMAPEQFEDSKRVGPPADVWALGVILYECLTGTRPFCGSTNGEVMCSVQAARPVPPRKLAPAVPADLEAVCLRCLSRKPAARYADANELAAVLEAFAKPPPPPPPPPPTPAPSRFLTILLSMAAGSVLTLAAVFVGWLIGRDGPPPKTVPTVPAVATRPPPLLDGGPLLDPGPPGADPEWRLVRQWVAGAVRRSPDQPPAGPRVAVSPSGEHIATHTLDGLRFWDTASGVCSVSYHEPGAALAAPLQWDAAGRKVLLAGGPRVGQLDSYHRDHHRLSRLGAAGWSGFATAAYDPTGAFVFGFGTDEADKAPAVGVWTDDATGKVAKTYSAAGRKARRMLCLEGGVVLCEHDPAGGRTEYTGFGAVDGSPAFQFQAEEGVARPDGRGLWHPGTGRLAVYDTGDGERVCTVIHTPTGRVTKVSPQLGWLLTARFSPDGTKLLVGCHDGRVRVYDAASGQAAGEFGPPEPVASISWSQDGGWVATASNDGVVKVWNTPALRRLVLRSGEPAPPPRPTP